MHITAKMPKRIEVDAKRNSSSGYSTPISEDPSELEEHADEAADFADRSASKTPDEKLTMCDEKTSSMLLVVLVSLT